MNSKFVIIPAIIIGVSILAVFAIDSVNLDKLCAEKGGTRNGDVCLIELPLATPDVETGFDLSGITVIKPNTMKYFYYPNPEDTENRDVFQKFILIRLPEELGGGADDISAFRAYSALSVGDHCLIKYWPHEGRKRIEDPCWGSMYRAIDGLLTGGPKPVINTTPVALPQLDLSLDENGSLYVEPPTWTLDENGVIGVGRQISLDEISTGSQILMDSFEKSHPHYPLIPLNFAGHTLSEIQSDGNRVVLRYFDFTSMYGYLTFDIGLATAQDQQYLLNLVKSNSEFWQIGDTVIRIGGNAFEKNNEPDKFKEYEIQFIKDGYNFRVGGKNLEFMKKEIIANYFPDFEYSDLFLVSITVK
ncbi:hypothetical protein [Nitrosopumilus ureiphilus]|uniref:Uncharacterized protein n=1 Tax=Nitrosopumilus ureiphilus TaxID=1470067 RepID=A0A7D5RBP4_9ARCH|nr:hypothetical protein [Nitrosopumilus ureiphilus]QLH07142.1 hypothetical protein C5F50_08690 [Nitrosopumilus ureiphilus]